MAEALGEAPHVKVPDGDPAPLRGGPTGAVERVCHRPARFDEKGHSVRRSRYERDTVHGPGKSSRCNATTRQRHIVIMSGSSMQPAVCHPRNDIRRNIPSLPATEHHCVVCQACLPEGEVSRRCVRGSPLASSCRGADGEEAEDDVLASGDRR